MSRFLDDANNEYLEVDATPVTAAPFSVAFWVYPEEYGNDVPFFLGDKDAAAEWYFVRLNIDGLAVTWSARTAAGANNAVTTAGYTLNAWHHIVAVAAASNSRAIYIAGGNKGTDNQERVPSGVDRISLGRNGSSGPGAYYTGRIAEVAIWNVALNDEEVAALAGGVPPSRIRPESLVAYWPLYGVASPEADYRGTYNLALFSGDSGPVQADHSPTAPPFGFDLEQVMVAAVAPPAVFVKQIKFANLGADLFDGALIL